MVYIRIRLKESLRGIWTLRVRDLTLLVAVEDCFCYTPRPSKTPQLRNIPEIMFEIQLKQISRVYSLIQAFWKVWALLY